jgi:alpha(1,3/1,4) fucosyltransferase
VNREILLRAKGFLGDIVLDPPPPSLTPRETEGPYRELAKSLAKFGYDLRTSKTLRHTPVAEIHVNVQPVVRGPSFLLRMESGFVVPENDDLEKLRQYTKVFTWDRNLSTQQGFHFVTHPQDLPLSSHVRWSDKENRKLPFCLIAANKMLRQSTPRDLYPERQRIILWFERHAPSSFSLYGRNWNLPMASRSLRGVVQRGLGKIGLAGQSLRVYRGELPDKCTVLQQTQFCFALENVEGLEGYLTEKIFDSMYEGCVPIYLGDPTADSIFPKEAYIRYQRNESLEHLYTRLMSMSNQEYLDRQAAIKDVLNSESCKALSSSRYAAVVSRTVCESLSQELSNGD